ncbi:chorismate-binding protein [Flavobacteriaceae bacterium TP-CH-4]|uniref:Chorismate-binding protein n=1 Tax=Pelagihabitans pacificus TaxID=2696054 RepID=A0A967EDE0_9FLAO|nr:chorismate-binding protein [Pelagihabitans pacificus]NHF59238.1 chorismate-binding protein [Pelagihabitans pacificus]
MFSALMDKVLAQLSQELPFVVYSKPDERVVKAIFQEDAKIHTISDFTETGFVFAPFDSESPAILIKNTETPEATEYPFETEAYEHPTVPLADTSQKKFHIQLVEKAVAKIKTTDLEKVVLSRRLNVPCTTHVIELFRRILARYPNAFRYLWYHPKVGCWLGATPEILVSIENKRFTSMSLAGTKPYVEGGTPSWGKKEQEEQKLVTDYMKSVLKGKTVDLQVATPETVRAGNLWHLQTRLSGRTKGNPNDLIKALHPTPAVCGSPMLMAKNFILTNENYPREFYTGFLGELNFINEINRTSDKNNRENKAYRAVKASTSLFVNLRCMQVLEDNVLLYVGGGITAASDPIGEWEETVNKSKTMLQVLTKA